MDYQFVLFGYRLTDKATYKAAANALGLDTFTLDHAKRYQIDLQIRCTDAQLGNFLAQRVLNGCRSNGVIELEIKAIGSHSPSIPVPVFNPNIDVR